MVIGIFDIIGCQCSRCFFGGYQTNDFHFGRLIFYFPGIYSGELSNILLFRSSGSDPSDVIDVKQTWWWKVIKEGGYKLGVNDSYSGATISYMGYKDEDYTSRSFITRLPNLGNPDIILIFGATNDSWCWWTCEGNIDTMTSNALTFLTYRPAIWPNSCSRHRKDIPMYNCISLSTLSCAMR